jgi:hypothetical protein
VDIEEALMLITAFVLGGLFGFTICAVLATKRDYHPMPEPAKKPKVNTVRCSCGSEFSFGSAEHSMPGNHLGHTMTYFYQPRGDDGKPNA